MSEEMNNSEVVGKYVIVTDLNFSDFMKDKDGKINVYDTLKEAGLVCGMYEFDDALVLKVEFNHVEK